MKSRVISRLGMMLALCIAIPTSGRAGPILDALHHRQADCPPSSYSAMHYWAPTLARWHERRQGGVADTFTPTDFPDMTPRTRLTQYPCPGVSPRTSAAEYPR
jgi:hypothetical protein